MCAANPALYSSTIIWFDPIPSGALQQLANELLTRELSELPKQNIDEAAKLITQIHKPMEEKYKTCPRDFYNVL